MKRYVVVYNKNIVRHIITWETDETLEEFKDWYYKYYRKFDSDEFKILNSMDEACDFANNFKKETNINGKVNK